MFHYVDVTINGEKYFVNIYYSLCSKPLKTRLKEIEMLPPDKQPTDCALPGRCRPYGTKDFNLVG
jgi:hypothetical protein